MLVETSSQQLYLVLDPEHCKLPIIEVLQSAIAGGVGIVQLRCKKRSTAKFIKLAQVVKKIVAPHCIPLIINDNIDVALQSNADGLHIGQNDVEYPIAREKMGPDKIIGLTIENLEQVKIAESWNVNYFGVGPVFKTSTKPDAPMELQRDGLIDIYQQTNKPVYAIGGINKNNAADVISCGAKGIAVVSAICGSDDPEKSTKELFRIMTNGVWNQTITRCLQ